MAVAVAVEILKLAILDVGALDLLGRLVALRGLHAVRDAAHVDLRRRGALAGMEAGGDENGVELAVDFENVALADGAGDNLHRWSSLVAGLDGAKGCRPCDFGRNILILRPEASIFPAGVNRPRNP